MKNLLEKIGVKREPKYKKDLKKSGKQLKKVWKYIRKKRVIQKVFVIFMGLAFLATAILPYIL